MKGVKLFEGLDGSRVSEIAQGAWIVSHQRATRIVSRGDTLEGLFTVFAGNLKLYMLSCGGNERVLRILRPGDSFGEVIMFNSIPSPVFVESLSTVTLGYFPRDVVNEALASDPQFTNAMLCGMGAMMRELIQDLETCCLQNACQRTINYLLREAESAPPPHVEIQLPGPKAVVASLLNVSAETFSRELHRLQDRGFIEINRRIIYVRDREGLIGAAEDAEPMRRTH